MAGPVGNVVVATLLKKQQKEPNTTPKKATAMIAPMQARISAMPTP